MYIFLPKLINSGMSKNIFLSLFLIVVVGLSSTSFAQDDLDFDTFETSEGLLELWFIGHGTLMFKINDFVIHVDPVSREGDYDVLPGADLVLITHSHGDHLDPVALKKISNDQTISICNAGSSSEFTDPIILKNGDKIDLESKLGLSLQVEAHPAYNIVHERSPGNPYHPKGEGNGYVLRIGDKSIYVAGDTEQIPEMRDLKNIDIAFLPMNLPYTMSPEMFVEAAKLFNPSIVYPYHFGSSDTSKLADLLEASDIEVRIRNF